MAVWLVVGSGGGGSGAGYRWLVSALEGVRAEHLSVRDQQVPLAAVFGLWLRQS